MFLGRSLLLMGLRNSADSSYPHIAADGLIHSLFRSRKAADSNSNIAYLLREMKGTSITVICSIPIPENSSYIIWLDLLISLGILNKLCRLCLSQFRKLKNPFLLMTLTSIELGLGSEVNRP